MHHRCRRICRFNRAEGALRRSLLASGVGAMLMASGCRGPQPAGLADSLLNPVTVVVAQPPAKANAAVALARKAETKASSESAGLATPEGVVSPVRTVSFEAETAPPAPPVERMEADASEGPAPFAELAPADAAPVVASGVMRLSDVEGLSLQHNPALRQAASIVHKAQGTRYQLGRYPNPTIGYNSEEIGANGDAGMHGVFVSQTIVMGNKLELSQRVADREVQARLWQAEAQRLRVCNDVRRLFYETLGAQERVKLARELEEIAQGGVSNAEALKEALQASDPDVLQAEIQLREVQIIVRNAEYQHQAAWKQLASAIGLPDLPLATLEYPLYDSQPQRDREVAWQQLLAQSPQLQQAYSEAAGARAAIERQQAQPIPNLQLQTSFMHNTNSGDEVASVMVGVPVPIFNRNEGNISRAAAEYQRACWNIQRLQLSLESELAEAFRVYQDALNRALVYSDIVPREQRTLDLIQAAYPLQFDFLRLLTARRSYYEARVNYLEAVVDLRQAEVALDGLLLSGALEAPADTGFDDGLRGQALSGQ
jgi:cobalt-zinc-cadmium efflux system outer membrane protein